MAYIHKNTTKIKEFNTFKFFKSMGLQVLVDVEKISV
jgi:hypothetical protein